MILSLHAAGAETTLRLLQTDGKVLATDTWESGRSLSDDLLRHITDFLASEKINIHQLSGIVIFSGPGSFTSLRIGHAVANALADGLSIPIVGTMEDDWEEEGITQLKTSQLKEPALPFYGAEPNITKPR